MQWGWCGFVTCVFQATSAFQEEVPEIVARAS